jgi:hypothetical protein
MTSRKGDVIARRVFYVLVILSILGFTAFPQTEASAPAAGESTAFSIMDYVDVGVYSALREDMFPDKSRFLGGATLQALLPVLALSEDAELQVRMGVNAGASWFYMLEYVLAVRISEDFDLVAGWSETHLSESSFDGVTARQVGMQGAVFTGFGYKLDPLWLRLDLHFYVENMHLVDRIGSVDDFREHKSPASISFKIVW